MKSIQFNYFASGSDLELIASAILAWSPSITIFAPRALGTEIQGTPVVEKSQLIPETDGQMMFLAIGGYEDQVCTDIVSDEISCIAIRENPVLEYSPSAPADSETVRIGRFYASFDDQEFKNKVRVLFGSLKKSAIKLGKVDLWVFPEVARTKRTLLLWGGVAWDNPLLPLESK